MDLRSLMPAELAERVRAAGEPAYRAEQVFRWLHGRGVESVDAMSNVPRHLAEALAAEAPLRALRGRHHPGGDATARASCASAPPTGARSNRCSIPDENRTEPLDFHAGRQARGPSDDDDGDREAEDNPADPNRRQRLPGRLLRDKLTLCVSSQVGCALDCALLRDRDAGLHAATSTAGEIVEQVYRADAASPAGAPRTWSSWAWASRCTTSTASRARSGYCSTPGARRSRRGGSPSRPSALVPGSRSSAS